MQVISVAYHRAASVILGVVYAFLVSRVWWPSQTCRELGKGLGECTECATTTDDGHPAKGLDETTALLRRAAAAIINASIVFMVMCVPTLCF